MNLLSVATLVRRPNFRPSCVKLLVSTSTVASSQWQEDVYLQHGLSTVWHVDGHRHCAAAQGNTDDEPAAALSRVVELLLQQQGSNLSILHVSSRFPVHQPALRPLAACTRLRQLQLALKPPDLEAIAPLSQLQSLTVDLSARRIGKQEASLAPLRALSALTRLELSTASRGALGSHDLGCEAHDDVSELAGLPGLVELSLPAAYLGGGELAVLAGSLTALTSLHVHLLKVAPHAAGSPGAPPPLSWPLPPALRRLSADLAEVEALAALRPPQSLAELELGDSSDSAHGTLGGLYFGPHSAVSPAWRVQEGCGDVMRGAVGLLAQRLRTGPAPVGRALQVCVPDKHTWLLGDRHGWRGHKEWLPELRPLGLSELCLHRLELDPGDAAMLASAAPELKELTLSSCRVLPEALTLLRRLLRMRRLRLEYLETWHLERPERAGYGLLMLCMESPALQAIDIRLPEEEAQLMRQGVIEWVMEHLGLLGGPRVEIRVL